MKIFSRAKLAVQNYQFKLWQLRNPGATFKDYFAKIAKSDLARGREHPTLGVTIGTAGQWKIQGLVKYGLKPDDVCVDYGCGTLRMGVRAIQFLNRGCYWGLDIDQGLLDEGARLIGPELESKAPHLRVISPATVREAAAANPAFLFSLKVLIHVHPDELDEYFANIITIIGRSGRAIIEGKWSPGKTFQFGRQSWAHSLDSLSEIVARHGFRLAVIEETDRPFIVVGEAAKAGTLEVRACG